MNCAAFKTKPQSERKVPRLMAARSKEQIAKSNCGQSLGMTGVWPNTDTSLRSA
jgi:K+/H+ antiporter YhaU regulatory subunit KhtT